MPEWLPYILVPVLTGIFSYIGAFAAVRTDIAWIKKTLADHAQEIRTLHSRVTRGH